MFTFFLYFDSLLMKLKLIVRFNLNVLQIESRRISLFDEYKIDNFSYNKENENTRLAVVMEKPVKLGRGGGSWWMVHKILVTVQTTGQNPLSLDWAWTLEWDLAYGLSI